MDMRRFVSISHLDGDLQALPKLHSLVQERRPDGVLFSGGILGNTALTHADKLHTWEKFFDGMGKLGIFTALIPGVTDAPLREFLRLAKEAEVEYPNLRVAHAWLFEEGDVALCGLGGELTEAEEQTEEKLSYARTSAEYFLRALWQAEQPQKVLLLSVPPPGQLGGEAGNRICGDYIDSYHPSLCVVSGPTERRGFQRIARTLVVNPGRLADGSAAWIDWNRDRNEQVEMLRL
jgi:Icc-related predicted phosphoesterase